MLFGARGLTASYLSTRAGLKRIEGLQSAASITPERWWYSLELAAFLQATGDWKGAAAHYDRAIAAYRGCSACWMGLAELQATSGADPSAAIAEAVRYGRADTDIRLRAGTLYARLGRHEEAGREFAAAQRGTGEERDAFYRLLHRVYDVAFLLEHVIEPGDIGTYFSYVRQHRPLEEARQVWAKYRQESSDKGEVQRAAFAHRLLHDGEVGEAWRIRFEAEPRPEAAILEGGFEKTADARPFGWHLVSAEGVEPQIVPCEDCREPTLALRVRFDGKANPNFSGVWQDVPVSEGASYVLRARARAVHITSASGPRLAVRGIGVGDRCRLWAVSPEWKLNSPWQEIEVPFRVPAGCRGVRIMVARSSTQQLNKAIGGELWLDDLELSLVADSAAGGAS